MAHTKMHDDELHTDAELVRRLLADQLPHWADLPIERVASSGTDNALYRLGADMVVRLPRIHWAAGNVEKDHELLPKVAPHLPVETPVLLEVGAPAEGFPWSWGVYRWLEGEHPVAGEAGESLALEVASFIRSLQAIDSAGGPRARRGLPLASLDEGTRQALANLAAPIDREAAEAAWGAALGVPDWKGPPTWFHGDLMPGNLLLRGGSLAVVLDWNAAGVGDPACDCLAAWTLFDRPARETFRAALDIDGDTWERGRGWALSTGLNAIDYYRETNPVLAANARFRLEQILGE